MADLYRVQKIALPILREALGEDVKVGSWVEDVDYRTIPLVNVRRIGGTRNKKYPRKLARPVIEMTVVTGGDLPTCENLYDDALLALYDAVRYQTQTEFGYLHSITETMGATQFSSSFQDSWRVQGLIALGIRPPRN